jgi:hypothetical protein
MIVLELSFANGSVRSTMQGESYRDVNRKIFQGCS